MGNWLNRLRIPLWTSRLSLLRSITSSAPQSEMSPADTDTADTAPCPPSPDKSDFGICRCYYRRNFFVHRWKEHFDLPDGSGPDRPRDLEAFRRRFEAARPDDWRQAWREVQEELARRRGFQPGLVKLRREVAEKYEPLHRDVYKLSRDFFDPEFLRAVDDAKAGRTPPVDLVRPLKRGAFVLPVFKPEFCQRLLEELENFRLTDLPRNKPNTMNKGGLILDDLGFTPFFDALRDEYIQPLCDAVYGEQAYQLDSHRAFTVRYEPGSFDISGLHTHYDNAETTMNVSLNEGFDGGELVFTGLKTEEESALADNFGYEHKLGQGMLHPGALRHAALPVQGAPRTNLIVWMRSSKERSNVCARCGEKPEVEQVDVGYGDGFRVDA